MDPRKACKLHTKWVSCFLLEEREGRGFLRRLCKALHVDAVLRFRSREFFKWLGGKRLPVSRIKIPLPFVGFGNSFQSCVAAGQHLYQARPEEGQLERPAEHAKPGGETDLIAYPGAIIHPRKVMIMLVKEKDALSGHDFAKIRAGPDDINAATVFEPSPSQSHLPSDEVSYLQRADAYSGGR